MVLGLNVCLFCSLELVLRDLNQWLHFLTAAWTYGLTKEPSAANESVPIRREWRVVARVWRVCAHTDNGELACAVNQKAPRGGCVHLAGCTLAGEIPVHYCDEQECLNKTLPKT